MILLPSNETACRNVRGLNSPPTQEAVATFLKRHRLDVFGILETKIEDLANLHQILIERFGGWHATHNFECTPGGRILVLWNPQVVHIQIFQIAEQFIHWAIQCRQSQTSIQVTFICVFYTIVNRRPLWDGLTVIGSTMTMPWLCVGDYNSYLKPEDKSGGPVMTGYMVRDFEACCVQNGLTDLNSTGLFYTWWNKSIWCKLDWALVNQLWLGAAFVSSSIFIHLALSMIIPLVWLRLRRLVPWLNVLSFILICGLAILISKIWCIQFGMRRCMVLDSLYYARN